MEETRGWQETIRDSELLVIPGNSFHVAASDAERFLAEHSHDAATTAV